VYSFIISFIVANCVLTLFNKDNDDDDDKVQYLIFDRLFCSLVSSGPWLF